MSADGASPREDPESDTAQGEGRDDTGDGDEENDGISRRQLLAGALAVGGVGGAAYLLTREDIGLGGDQVRIPFGVWEEIRAGLRESPDHLGGTADELVENGDARAIFEFVRDEIALQPPGLENNAGFSSAVRGGPQATLRAGIATPREKAQLLVSLLQRAGYAAEIRVYEKPLTEQQLRDLYFGEHGHEFDPGFDDTQLTEWIDLMGESERTPDDFEIVDENGAESAALADRILDVLPQDAVANGFETEGVDAVPVVRFGEGVDAADETDGSDGNDTDGGNDGISEEDWQYADLFHAEDSFGSDIDPDAVGPAPDPDIGGVSVRVEAARMDEPEQRIELVSGDWDATDLAGRQLKVSTHPGRTPLDDPTLRFDDVDTYVPALAVQDPGTPRSERERISVVGDPFTLTGERFTIDDTGTLRKGTTILHEGEEEWDLLIEWPDGTQETIEPIESDQSIEDYYNYDEDTADADFPDEVEQYRTSVVFLYRDTNSGRLSLVVVHDHPDEGDGGNARMTFEGAGGFRWLVQDGDQSSPDRDNYNSRNGEPTRYPTGTWGWVSRHTDGGAIGPLRFPFDIEITHVGNWNGNQRNGLDNWIFLNGSIDNAVEVTAFDDDTGDVSIRLFSELVSEGETTRERVDAPSAADVESVDVRVLARNYPDIYLTVDARDADDDRVEAIPTGAIIAREDDTVVSTERVPRDELPETGEADAEDGPLVLKYRTPHREDSSGTRTVTVEIRGGDDDEATYTVPSDPVDPRTNRGLCGLYLTVTVGDRTVERTLAGWDPALDADRSPAESDHQAVFSALWGQYTLSFETAGVGMSVTLDDELGGKMTLEDIDTAWREGETADMNDAAADGHGLVSQLPAPFHPRLPDRVTEDSLTYGVGLRTTLSGARPVFGENYERREVDVLPTAGVRTVTAESDRRREFELTAQRTARWSVMERAAFETSTGSLLEDTTLATSENAADAMSGVVRMRHQVATERRSVSENDYQVTAASGRTAAFWHVDGQTGQLVGVLPDGRGGGWGKQIIRQLEKIQEVIEALETAGTVIGNIPPPSAEGAVAEVYGVYLAKLYAIAATSIATMSPEEVNAAAAEIISKKVCNIAYTITDVAPGMKAATSDLAAFMNNLHNAKDHTASTCLQNEYTGD